MLEASAPFDVVGGGHSGRIASNVGRVFALVHLRADRGVSELSPEQRRELRTRT